MEITPGYNLSNARECALYARMAYDGPPTIASASTGTHLIVRELDNAIVIAFRGTKDLHDLITDARCVRARLPHGIQIHIGFLAAMDSVSSKIFDVLIKLPEKPIFITGHSLGGALAMLCAYELAQSLTFLDRIHSVYTFGQPRVGNGAFKRHYNDLACGPQFEHDPRQELGDVTFRFINAEDIVPRVPGWLVGYRHAGQRVFFDAFNQLEFKPSLWAMALSDVFGLCNAWTTRREITLLTCHGIDRYIEQLSSFRNPPPSLT